MSERLKGKYQKLSHRSSSVKLNFMNYCIESNEREFSIREKEKVAAFPGGKGFSSFRPPHFLFNNFPLIHSADAFKTTCTLDLLAFSCLPLLKLLITRKIFNVSCLFFLRPPLRKMRKCFKV